jgi:hypothetical protein
MTIWQKTFGWRAFSGLGGAVGIWSAVALMTAIGVVLALALARASSGGNRTLPSLITLYSVGLATMAAQVLAVLGLQIACGYVYGRIAALIAAFMVGMGLAAVVTAAGTRRPRLSAWLPVLLAAPPLVVALIIQWAGRGGALPRLAAELGLPLVAFATGALGGLVFSAAAAALTSHARHLGKAASVAYAADLAGACVAGLGTGLVLVPALGVAGTAYAVAAATLAALAVGSICRRLLSEPRLR